MHTVSILLVVTLAAVVAPLIAAAVPGTFAPPIVVLELALGILIGPVFGIAHADELIRLLSSLGLAMLFFLAGLELDLSRIRGRPLLLGALGWVASLVIALVLTTALDALGLDLPVPFVALALCTTALGTLVPIWRDAGVFDTRLGRYAMAAGVCGELLPIVLMSVLLTGSAHRVDTALTLVAFTLIALGCVVAALRVHPAWAVDLLSRTMHLSSQLPIRVSVLVLVSLVALADRLGLDVILGAFTAGMLVGIAVPPPAREGAFTHKLDALGFGFFVPIFFIASGMTFDLDALLGDASSLVFIPLFLVSLLVVRGAPALLLYREEIAARRDRIGLALYSSASLPLIVAITTIAVAGGHLPSATAAAMVAAGMLSVLVFPLAALLLDARAARAGNNTQIRYEGAV
jgi:Kef-type K+ transport system membrane component KefB